jgi:uncharacterized membrane protein YqjE
VHSTADRSIADLLSDIAGNLQHIVRAEVRLAKAELREDVITARRSGVLIAAGACAGLFAVGFALAALAYALATVVAPPFAALIVAAVAGVAAAACIAAGKNQLKNIGLPKTAATIQENIQWAKSRGK